MLSAKSNPILYRYFSPAVAVLQHLFFCYIGSMLHRPIFSVVKPSVWQSLSELASRAGLKLSNYICGSVQNKAEEAA